MSKPRDDRQVELFRPALDAIIDLRHPLVRLAAELDWEFVGARFSAVYRPGPGNQWRNAIQIMGGRLIKFSAQLTF